MASDFSPVSIPAHAGIGFRTQHTHEFLDRKPRLGFVEVHAETFMAPGGPRVRALEAIRRNYPLSIHGVGLSLGSAEGIDEAHLGRLKALVDRFEPTLVSEHVAWSVTGGIYYNDLLPIPYTDEALAVICRNIDRMQEALQRAVLVENPSTYVGFEASTMAEWQFLAEIVRRTGCGLLLDVNNIHVSAHNQRFDPAPYLDALPFEAVGEIHVAGHAIRQIDPDTVLLIDDHGSHVPDPVWRLFEEALRRAGPRPTLIEWDTNLPPLVDLLAEAAKAETVLERARPQRLSHAA